MFRLKNYFKNYLNLFQKQPAANFFTLTNLLKKNLTFSSNIFWFLQRYLLLLLSLVVLVVVSVVVVVVMVMVVVVQVAVVVLVKCWPELINNKLEARASKYKSGARAGKRKFGARVVKYKSGAKPGKYKLRAKAGPGPSKRPGAGKYKYPDIITDSCLIKRLKFMYSKIKKSKGQSQIFRKENFTKMAKSFQICKGLHSHNLSSWKF